MNQPNQPAPKYPIGGYAPSSYSCKCVTCYEIFMGDKRTVQCEPCAIKATASQPAPKSAEEVLNELFYKPELHDYYDAIIKAMQTYASQFARYIPDEEIDAMWPYADIPEGHNIDELLNLTRREAAKEMRDKIFGGVKP